MGTNYYYYYYYYYYDYGNPVTCPVCGASSLTKQVHIGKSSAGWCFALHVTDEIKNLEDWKVIWETGGVIKDEYDRTLSPKKMLKIITERSWDGQAHDDEFLRRNYAVHGPNGLLRHDISTDSRCIGHGEGTWDLITGEFS